MVHFVDKVKSFCTGADLILNLGESDGDMSQSQNKKAQHTFKNRWVGRFFMPSIYATFYVIFSVDEESSEESLRPSSTPPPQTNDAQGKCLIYQDMYLTIGCVNTVTCIMKLQIHLSFQL